MDLAAEFLKAYGPPGLICVILWINLYKSEKREEKKDTRIQWLENKLTESYDERIVAADRVAEAIHVSSRAMENLTIEVRANR